MKTSESISKIAPALLEAQKSTTFASKDATNPHFKSKYADLETVVDAIKAPLNSNGIMFIQTFSPSPPGFLCLTTRLMHISGEWLEDTLTMPLQKNDAQGYGSAATYSRRYALAAITGLYQADDDGNEATKPVQQPSMTDSQAEDLRIAIDECVSVDQIGGLLKTAVKNNATKSQLEKLQAVATARKTKLMEKK